MHGSWLERMPPALWVHMVGAHREACGFEGRSGSRARSTKKWCRVRRRQGFGISLYGMLLWTVPALIRP